MTTVNEDTELRSWTDHGDRFARFEFAAPTAQTDLGSASDRSMSLETDDFDLVVDPRAH